MRGLLSTGLGDSGADQEGVLEVWEDYLDEDEVEGPAAGHRGGRISGDDLDPRVTGEKPARDLGESWVDLGREEGAFRGHRAGHPRGSHADPGAELGYLGVPAGRGRRRARSGGAAGGEHG